MAGCAYGPVILIRPAYREDRGLLEHELEHRRQWLRSFGLHGLLYLLSDRYKLWAEVAAYKRQLIYSPGRERRFAEFIATRYGLSVSVEEVEGVLIG
jgi:chorismate mutase